jgi:hypothetical protein
MAPSRFAVFAATLAMVGALKIRSADNPVDVFALRKQVLSSSVVQAKIAKTCEAHKKVPQCESKAGDALFCQLLGRSHPDLAAAHCASAKKAGAVLLQIPAQPAPKPAQAKVNLSALKTKVLSSAVVQDKIKKSCAQHENVAECEARAGDAVFCELLNRSNPDLAASQCEAKQAPVLLQVSTQKAPEDELAKEMTHDLEMNFNKIAPFGKEDTAKELQDHAAKTQDTLVDAVENAEVAEIKRAVFRALTRLRAATIKEFDTIARLETQAIDAYNDAHHYRAENPLAHLHEDEAPVETDKLKSFH